MRNVTTHFRWSFALLAVAALAACDQEKLTAPTELEPSYNTVQPPGVQLVKNGPIGSTGTFRIEATGGSLPLGPIVTINACDGAGGVVCGVGPIVWVPTSNDEVTVTITEIDLSAGLVFNQIQATKTMNGVTTFWAVYAPAPPTTSFTMNGTSTAVINFKNVGVVVPPLEVVKTAAGTYEQPITWTLEKSVNPSSHSGVAGSVAGSSTWTVVATKIVGAATNHQVTGTISVTNPAGAPLTRTFSVTDVVGGVAATVVCPKNTAAPGETVVCTYSAAVAGATSNTATVSSTGYPDVTATVPVSYTGSFTGDENVTLADPRFTYSNVISSSSTVTFPESFPCPSDASLYTNGTYSYSVVNTATLTGNNTNLSDDATVNVTCTYPQNGETATGAGFPWSATQGAPSNWFMYTPWVTTGVHRGISATATSTQPAGTNLIAGQHYVAGRITGTRGTTTSITITLNSDWGFDGGQISNVKINPMSCTTGQPYKSPGQFAVHRTASAGATSITVTGLPNTACYGIHADVVEK